MFSNVAALAGASALSDTFTDTNGTNITAHTMTSGPGWTLYSGSGSIQSNKLESGTDGTPLLCVSSAGQALRCAALDVTLPGSGMFGAGVAFGVVDANNGYLLLLTNDGGSSYVTLAQLAGVM